MHGQLAQHLCPSKSKNHPPIPRGTWGNFGETRGVVGKRCVLEHKVAISLKRIKIEEKLLWRRAYRNSPTLFPTAPSPTHYGLHFPKIWVRTHPKLQSLLSQEREKLRISNLASTFTGSIRTKAHKNFGEKGAWVYPGTAHCPVFFRYPLLPQERGKLRISNLASIFRASIRTKAH